MSYANNLNIIATSTTPSANSKQVVVRGETTIMLKSKDFLVSDLRSAIADMSPSTMITGFDFQTEDGNPCVKICWQYDKTVMDPVSTPTPRSYIGDLNLEYDATVPIRASKNIIGADTATYKKEAK